MERIVKKYGGSLGINLGAEETKARNIEVGDTLEIEILRIKKKLEKLLKKQKNEKM
jgi:antitoxin component of MazEF toxin-antitoxin module